MNTDILLENAPALKVGQKKYLIYAPYQKVFIELPIEQIRNSEKIAELKRNGLFEFPKLDLHEDKAIRIVLNITNKCNFACKYCWAKSSPKGTEVMSPQTARNIVTKLSVVQKINRIHFMGGEPTLNIENIKAVVNYFVENKFSPLPIFYLTSNGTMTQDDLDWLIRNKFVFSISWDGIGKAHDAQRPLSGGKESERIVRDTIKKILRDNSSLLRIRMTISKINMPYLYESVAWLADNGAKYIHIEPVSPDGRGIEYAKINSVNPEEFVDEFFKIVDLAEEKHVCLMNSSLANLYTPREYYCSALKHQVYNFNPDGSISQCYKVQSLNDPLAAKFVIGEYDDKRGVINIDNIKSNKLSAISVSDNNDYKDLYLKYIYAGGCPYKRSMSQSNAMGKIFDNINNKIIRRAILHIYKRAINGHGSVLEGYLKFYGMIDNINEKKDKKEENNQSNKILNKLKKENIKYIPIVINSRNQQIGIDACDICI